MASDPLILDQLRVLLQGTDSLTEKKMFGGSCFMSHGNMIGGVSNKDEYIIRVGAESWQECLALPDARPTDFTKAAPMKGFVLIDPNGNQETLVTCLERALEYVASLPPK